MSPRPRSRPAFPNEILSMICEFPPAPCELHNSLNTARPSTLCAAAATLRPTPGADGGCRVTRSDDARSPIAPRSTPPSSCWRRLSRRARLSSSSTATWHCQPFQRGGRIDPEGSSAAGISLGLEASCLGLAEPAAELRDHDPARRWQPASRASVSASRVAIGGRSSYMVFCSRHHRRGRTARADRASEPGGRQDQPRRRRHRSRPAAIVYTNAAFSGNVRIPGRGGAVDGRRNELLAGRV